MTNEIPEVVWQHIETWMTAGKGPLDPDHGTVEIMAAHPDIEGDDADFYITPTRDAVRNEYHRQAKRFKVDPSQHPDKQVVFDGFDRLQKAYLIDRLYLVEVEADDLNANERKRMNNAALKPLERNGNRYVVMRPKPVLVKIEDLTDEELDQKEQEYRDMASGCIAHANEIRTYRRARRRSA